MAAVIIVVLVVVFSALSWSVQRRINQRALNQRVNGNPRWWNKPLTPGPVYDAEMRAKDHGDATANYTGAGDFRRRRGGSAWLPWPVWAVVGVILIVVGAVLHTSPLAFGGPIAIGVVALAAAAIRLRDDRHNRRFQASRNDR